MIRSPHLPSDRRNAFTLIELLTVIAIILVLAGLLLHVAGMANYKSSLSRAQAEVKAMETALENYKTDNGAYPRLPTVSGGTTSYSDTLNAQQDNDPGGNSSQAKYQGASETLYQALSGVTVFGTTPTFGNKHYMEFKPSQLSDASSGKFTAPSASTVIVDPFGLVYGYSTINLYAVEQGSTNTSTTGYNPTFDLWSTAGYGTGGKAYPTTGVTATTYNTLWVKNW